jgi:tetratricopeptide (TPR) repeat protein
MSRLLQFIALIVLISPTRLQAQTVDSLWAVWNNKDLPDTARMQAMDYLAFDHYMYSKPDSAGILAGLLLDLARSRANTRYEAIALNAQGASLHLRGDLPNALEKYLACLAVLEKRHDERRMAKAHSNVGGILQELGESREAKKHFDLGIELGLRVGDSASTAANYLNAGVLLRQMGDSAASLDYFLRSAALNEGSSRQRDLQIALSNIGLCHLHSKEFGQADTLFARAIRIAHELDDPDLLAESYRCMGSSALDQGRNARALSYGQQALELAQHAGLTWETMMSSHLVYIAHKALGHPAEALSTFELHVRMKDSLENEDDRVGVARNITRSTYEKKLLTDSLAHATAIAQKDNERTIEHLRTERVRNRALTFGGVAVILLAGLSAYYITDRKRRIARFERDAAELETQALRSQMNPHFIFNALNSISAYVQEQAADKAVGFLSRFARLMRLVLENSRHAEVPLKDDLEALDAYLHLERIRCNEKFDYAIEVDPAIDPEELMVPPLVAQPFVENAIWHGMAGKEGKGHITMRFSKRDADLLVTIEDDGAGRGTTMDNGPHTTGKKRSLGTAITQARLDLVGKQHGRPAGFRYVDLPQGTRVELNLPLREVA